MNWSLFRSPLHAALALLIAGGFAAWLFALGAKPGAGPGSDRVYLLASGWAALILMVICFLYVPRKYAQKLRARLNRFLDALFETREFAFLARPFRALKGGVKALWRAQARGTGAGAGRRRAAGEAGGGGAPAPGGGGAGAGAASSRAGGVLPAMRFAGQTWGLRRLERARHTREMKARMERAEARVEEVRAQVMQGLLRSPREIRVRLGAIAREEGVSDIVRPLVRRAGDTGSGDGFLIGFEAREPLGRMSKWLHAHLWYGLAFGILVWLHGGGAWMSPMGALLTGLSAVVVVTGIAGIVLLAWLPGTLAARETQDLSYELAFARIEHLESEIRALTAALSDEDLGRAGIRRRELGRLSKVRDAASKLEPGDPLAPPLEDLAVLLAQKVRYESGGKRLRRLKFWANVWRLVHIPASVLLAGTVVLHVVSVWFY